MTAATKTSNAKKTSKSTPTKKAVKAQAPAPAPVESVVENTEVVAEEPLVTIESSMSGVLSSFSESIQTLTLSLTKLKADFFQCVGRLRHDQLARINTAS